MVGFAIPSDVLARYYRLAGGRVLLASGTDEHGTPVMVFADDEGVSPREVADRYSELIREDLRSLGISYDIFTRTTTANHYRIVRDLFKTLYENGYVFEEETLGAFSSTTGMALPDRYIEGTCPHCGYESARGDQCDNFGRQLDPTDLIDPRSRIDGQPPEFRQTKHLFFDLPAFKDALAQWIDSQSHWRQNVRNFSQGFVKEIRPRAITRDLDWGVPIPVPGYDGVPDKRIYVWFDAVIGYLSASVEWAANRGEPEAWRDWWQNPDARHYYVMGKDNITFHTVMWPSILLGYGAGGELGGGRATLELPDDVVASEFLTMEGKKFAASRGVGIYVGDFLSRYDVDALRYYLIAAGPESQDTDFTWSEFVRRNNDELVATWGNLVNRALTIAHRDFGEIPTPGELQPADEMVLTIVNEGFDAAGDLIEHASFKAALGDVMMTRAKAVNEYFSSQVVHELLGNGGTIAGELELREIEEEGGERHVVLTGEYESWVGEWAPSQLPAGRSLPPPRPLFKKLDPGQVVADELARMEERAAGK
jgi:methionyl-tRNA synthetase